MINLTQMWEEFDILRVEVLSFIESCVAATPTVIPQVVQILPSYIPTRFDLFTEDDDEVLEVWAKIGHIDFL